MNVFADALAWLVSAENYTADGSIPQRIAEHLWFTAVAVGSAALIAVPLGYFIGHTGKGRIWVVGSAGAARALPTFGLLLYLVLVMGVSQRTPAAIIALVLLAIPPLLAGAYAGIDQIDRSTLDAATAQGMTSWQLLRRVEIPLSLPLVIGGLRGATLQVVATVTLVAYVGLGGLGFDIIQGIPLRRFDQMVGSALLIVVLALALDGALAFLARVVTPEGVRSGRGTDVRARQAA
jgi:osmoprotectant transport system permease protein